VPVGAGTISHVGSKLVVSTSVPPRGRIASALGVLALMFACAAGASTAGSRTAPVDRLTLEQQVGQVLILSFAGTTVPGYVREALREQRVAGVILFGGNVVSPSQLRALTAALRA
jgi:hypothetical protein